MPVTHIITAVLLGIGATVTMDLWTMLLRHVFKITSLNYCLVGRWLAHMSERKFRHANIAASSPKAWECTTGWIAHYTIGIAFGLIFVALVPDTWLLQPTLTPSLIFSLATVTVPFLIMQPALGLGVAASKTLHPVKARFRSLATHAIFGLGLYASAGLLNQF